MASFCSTCGSPLGANSAFCGKCGTPAANTPRNQPVVPPISPAPKAGNTALKIIAIVLCLLFVGGIAVVGGVLYMAHRVKQTIVQKAAENGVDLNSLSNTSVNPAAQRALPRPCDVLSKQEAARLIGEPIDHTEERDASCLYFGPAGLSAKLAQENASATYKRAQVPGATVDGGEVATSVDQLVNSLGAQSGQIGSDRELPLLMLMVAADGKAQMTAVTATKAIFGSIGRSADSPGIGFGADIPGLGDKAVRVPKLGLNVLQGETLIRVIPGPLPDADAKTIAVARAVLPKL
jgi:hypothetical protein